MVETKTPGTELIPSPPGKLTQPKKLNRKPREDVFVPKIRIKMDDGTFLPVPEDSNANRNATIMLAEVARMFVKDQMRMYSERHRILTPAEVKDMMTAAKMVNEMAIVAHEDIFVPSGKTPKGEGAATKGMLQAVEAAARGMASGSAEAQSQAVQKFMELGKKTKKADVIDVEAVDVTPQKP